MRKWGVEPLAEAQLGQGQVCDLVLPVRFFHQVAPSLTLAHGSPFPHCAAQPAMRAPNVKA